MRHKRSQILEEKSRDGSMAAQYGNSNTTNSNGLNRGRVAIFIDGSNLFYAALQLGIEIDYTKLLCCLTAGSPLLRSFFTPE